jgi:hypothetical protein
LKFPEWHSSMNDEFSALMKNDTWILVPRQSHMNIIVCK